MCVYGCCVYVCACVCMCVHVYECVCVWWARHGIYVRTYDCVFVCVRILCVRVYGPDTITDKYLNVCNRQGAKAWCCRHNLLSVLHY